MNNKIEIQKKYYNKYKDTPEFKARAKAHRDKSRAKKTAEQKERARLYNKIWKQNWYPKIKDTEEFKEKRNIYQQKYRKEMSEEMRQKMKIRINKRNKKDREINPAKYMWYEAKKRAKNKNLDFNIEISDIFIPEICPVLDIPLFLIDGKRTDNSPSLDKINNSKGYIKGNIKVISFRANALKNNATVEELEAIVKYMKEN